MKPAILAVLLLAWSSALVSVRCPMRARQR
jgi:hypothetical protein